MCYADWSYMHYIRLQSGSPEGFQFTNLQVNLLSISVRIHILARYLFSRYRDWQEASFVGT